ncbi:hypothetical protein RRG08_067407 [Elysia crispata]|uniref:Uncharacterized protein n=1 Tax=Elysia crispata TaxID=231223 RepID=A0AAE0Y9X5_9GAST|nr:hypothetical protein RRG08_067407 [Elysia crispata]
MRENERPNTLDANIHTQWLLAWPSRPLGEACTLSPHSSHPLSSRFPDSSLRLQQFGDFHWKYFSGSERGQSRREVSAVPVSVLCRQD